MLRMVPWIVAVAIATAITASAHAQSGGRDAEARALFQAGQVAFEEGRYENALEYFRRSHELSQRPELLYNIGAAADRLRLDEEALGAFERFLEARPDAANRAEVEARIVVLRRATSAEPEPTVTAAEPAAPDPTPPIATPVEPSPTVDAGPGPAPWIVLGAGAAVAVAGAVLVGVAAGDVATVENAPAGSTWSAVRDAYDRSEPMSIAGFVLLGVGGAAAIAGLAWGIAASSGGEPEAEVALGPGSVTVRGTF